MSTKMPVKIACATVALAMLVLAGPAGAQYSGNRGLQNPAANMPSGPAMPGSTPNQRARNSYWKPGQLRGAMPGGTDPNVRGTNTGVPPCPPGRSNCVPAQ